MDGSGCFKTSRQSKVFDFTRLPEEPSIFDPVLGEFSRAVRFLSEFVNDLKKTVIASDEQVEYVPTQVMTEYLLKIYDRSENIAGILYPSAINGLTCAVFDVRNDCCIHFNRGWRRAENDELKLGLISRSVRVRRART